MKVRVRVRVRVRVTVRLGEAKFYSGRSNWMDF